MKLLISLALPWLLLATPTADECSSPPDDYYHLPLVSIYIVLFLFYKELIMKLEEHTFTINSHQNLQVGVPM